MHKFTLIIYLERLERNYEKNKNKTLIKLKKTNKKTK